MKRKLLRYCFILATILTLIFCFASSASAAKYLGDIDGDGSVTASDARLVLRMSVGLEELIEIEEHVYIEKVEKAATCTENGIMKHTCTDCGKSYTSEITATGHSYSEKVTVKATCTANGTKTFTCSKCFHSYTQTIKATGHNWSAATCTTARTCNICNATDGSALGHSLDNDNICKICGAEESIKVILPETPLEVSYVSQYFGILSTAKINKIYYEADGTTLTVYFDFEKIYEQYDASGLGGQCWWQCKLYDSEGYLIKSSPVWTDEMDVGEKQKGLSETFGDLTPGETYTLVVENKR